MVAAMVRNAVPTVKRKPLVVCHPSETVAAEIAGSADARRSDVGKKDLIHLDVSVVDRKGYSLSRPSGKEIFVYDVLHDRFLSLISSIPLYHLDSEYASENSVFCATITEEGSFSLKNFMLLFRHSSTNNISPTK